VGKSSRVRIVRAAKRREEASEEEGEGRERENNEARGEEGGEGEEPPNKEDKPPLVELWNTNQLKLTLQKPSLLYIAVKLTIIG
jgi:hypothetical protein